MSSGDFVALHVFLMVYECGWAWFWLNVCTRARVLLWVICVVDATSVFWFLIWLVVSLSLVVVDDVSVVFWLISFSLFVF